MTERFRPLLLETGTVFRIGDLADGSFGVSVALAESMDGIRLVTLECILAPFSDIVAGCYEFSFSILVTALDDGDLPFETQERAMAVPLIPERCRPYVVPTVAEALRALVTHVRPRIVYQVTKNARLPAKALAKYELLIDTLSTMGYRKVDFGNDGFGRRFWLMGCV